MHINQINTQQSTEKSAKTNSAVDVVVVTHERIEGTDLHPANTKFFSSVAEETTDVSANKRNSKELEFQNSCKQKQQTSFMTPTLAQGMV